MNSWAVSACYPRSTFYPLSDGPSIQNHRITKTYFRTCLIRRSCSQARLCLCTQCAMSDRAERTFVLLRYSLGGDRPSQTAHHAPVSYTHLRAHETPEHLVCRLLLEKKKKKIFFFFFFNDTATTEIYTRSLVGSVRCV